MWADVDNAWEQEKLEARKMLAVGAASTRQVRALLGADFSYAFQAYSLTPLLVH